MIAFALVVATLAAAPPYEEMKSARAYAFNAGSKNDDDRNCSELVEKGQLCPNASKPKALSEAQLKQAIELLKAYAPEGGSTTGCWNPHHGIEFLNEEGQRIAFVTVCFECQNIIRPRQGTEAMSDDTQSGWRALFKALGLNKNLKTL